MKKPTVAFSSSGATEQSQHLGEARGGAAAGLGGARFGGAAPRLARNLSMRPLPATRKTRHPSPSVQAVRAGYVGWTHRPITWVKLTTRDHQIIDRVTDSFLLREEEPMECLGRANPCYACHHAPFPGLRHTSLTSSH